MRRSNVVIMVILIGVLMASAVYANTYTGTLSTSNGMSGTGEWVTNNGSSGWFPASLTWTVTNENTNSGLWNYNYTLTVYRGDVSHFILEMAPDVTLKDIMSASGNFQGMELGDYSFSNGNSNPNMPGTIHGIKFNNASGTTYHMSFDTTHGPGWGDFYSKSGHSTAWDLGFTIHDIDPTAGAANGVFDHHVLVPGSLPEGVSPVPEPSGVLPLLAGLIGFVFLKRSSRQ